MCTIELGYVYIYTDFLHLVLFSTANELESIAPILFIYVGFEQILHAILS